MSHLVDTLELPFVTRDLPGEVVKSVALINKKCSSPGARANPSILHIAQTIVLKHPDYICARLAQAVAIIARDGKIGAAARSLEALWAMGVKAMDGRYPVQIRSSDSAACASFLRGATMYAEYLVYKADLAAVVDVLERVIAWDVEQATSATFVKAHVDQLLGKPNVVVALKAVAGIKHPMAFYALGLEYLRLPRHENEARLSFHNGFNLAPLVAIILLGGVELQVARSPVREHDAQLYVETYCLSEWRASELDELRHYAVLHAAPKTPVYAKL